MMFGALLCEVAVSHFVAGAIFGEVGVMLKWYCFFSRQAQYLVKHIFLGRCILAWDHFVKGSWRRKCNVFPWRREMQCVSMQNGL